MKTQASMSSTLARVNHKVNIIIKFLPIMYYPLDGNQIFKITDINRMQQNSKSNVQLQCKFKEYYQ